MRRDAQVAAKIDRRDVPAGELHRGRGRFPDENPFPRAVQRVLRQVDQEQLVHVVRCEVAVLRQPSEGQQEAAVR